MLMALILYCITIPILIEGLAQITSVMKAMEFFKLEVGFYAYVPMMCCSTLYQEGICDLRDIRC